MPNDNTPGGLLVIFCCVTGAGLGQGLVALLNNSSFVVCTPPGAIATVIGAGTGCLAGCVVYCVYINRQNLCYFLMARNNLQGEAITQAPTQQIMFSKKFSNDIKELYNKLDEFTKATENDRKPEEIYRLVQGIAATQDNDYVKMLQALFEDPVETLRKIDIEDNKDGKGGIALLLASLLLNAWLLDPNENLSNEHKKMFEKIVESQLETSAQLGTPAQHDMQPPSQTIGVSQDAQLTPREGLIIDAFRRIMQHSIQTSQSAGDAGNPPSPHSSSSFLYELPSRMQGFNHEQRS